MRRVLNSILAFALCTTGAGAKADAQMDADWLLAVSDTCVTMTLMDFDAPQPDLTGLGLMQGDQIYDIVAAIGADIMRFYKGRTREPADLRSPEDYGAAIATSMVNPTDEVSPKPSRVWSYSRDGLGLSHLRFAPGDSDFAERWPRGFCRIYAKAQMTSRDAEGVARAVVGERANCRNTGRNGTTVVFCERWQGRMDMSFEVQIFDEIEALDGSLVAPSLAVTFNHRVERAS